MYTHALCSINTYKYKYSNTCIIYIYMFFLQIICTWRERYIYRERGVCRERDRERAIPRTTQNETPEAIWDRVCHQSLEPLKTNPQKPSGIPFATRGQNTLKMTLQRPSGSPFATRARNTSKRCSRGHLGAFLSPEPGTAQNEPPEVIWEPFCHQTPEQLKTILQRPSGSPFATRAGTCSK